MSLNRPYSAWRPGFHDGLELCTGIYPGVFAARIVPFI